jgi:hypothetical protein
LKQALDNQRAIKIATIDPKGPLQNVYVIVNGAAQVRLGDNAHVLKNDVQDGIPFTAATPAQQSFVLWRGDLYAISDVPTNISVQRTGQVQQGV